VGSAALAGEGAGRPECPRLEIMPLSELVISAESLVTQGIQCHDAVSEVD
jgi:hypothetical protein